MRNTKTSNGYGGHVNLEYLWKEKVKVWRNWISTRIREFFSSLRMIGRMDAKGSQAAVG